MKCPVCAALFENRSILNEHIDSVHDGKKPFECKICHLTFSTKTNLEVHEERKHNPNYVGGEKKVVCNICHEMFSYQNFKYHKRKVHMKNQEILCTKCPAKFMTKSALKTHFEVLHEGKKPFKCPLCDRTFPQRYIMKAHISAVHEGKKPHLCPTCGVSFADKGNLKKHIAAVHKGIKRDQWKTGINKLSLIANNL